jgi:hypothetical protein
MDGRLTEEDGVARLSVLSSKQNEGISRFSENLAYLLKMPETN